ncbi:MAG: clostripain-related cysteine peptidase [Elusimicrobiales bacterium]|nr:clostripain-related cysteine peptidase [Elusimicrobiales bacterium]
MKRNICKVLEESMLRKLSLSAVAVSMFASLASAEVNFDGGKNLNIKEEIANSGVAVPEPTQDKSGILDWFFGKPPAAPKAGAEWTIMFFENAKNDLEPYLLKDLNEMEMIGSTDKINLVAQVGRIDGYDDSDGDWKGVRRYLITKDTDTTTMGSKMLQDLGQSDMGDYKTLAEFGKWAKATYPAKKYMLVISNHGAGWTKSLTRPITKGISYDEQSGNHINTVQLGLAMKDIGKLDVLGTDACLMQMAEVDYEIKDYVTYIVGSEETEPGDGYTYNDMLGPLAKKPAMSGAELAKLTVDAYSDHYAAQKTGSTQSYVLSASVPRLLTLTNAFTAAMTASGDKALARKARDGAVKFAMDENKDLYDFLRLVIAETKSADVKTAGQTLMTFITGELVAHNRTNDSAGGYWSGPVAYSPAKGIAAYFPNGALGDGYADLQWAKASQWDEFVTWMNQP